MCNKYIHKVYTAPVLKLYIVDSWGSTILVLGICSKKNK